MKTMEPPKLLSIKLRSGETIFAEELNEDEVSIEVLNPILIMLVPERQADGSFQEYLSSKPWHPYTSDKYFLIYKTDMIHYGPLKDYYRTYYLKTLISSSAEELNQELIEESIEKTADEHESDEDYCVEQFQTRLNLLAERLGIIDPESEENPDDEHISSVVLDEHPMMSATNDLILFDTHKTLQ